MSSNTLAFIPHPHKLDLTQAYFLPQTRRLKVCSLNTSHSRALDFHYSSKPLAIDLKQYKHHKQAKQNTRNQPQR